VVKRYPYRAEFLGGKFSKTGLVSKTLNVTYHKIRPDGITEEVTEPLQDCLRVNKTPGIDLDYWLDHATQQGLPRQNNTDGNLYYWNPREGAVAGFWADSGWVGLGCGWYPTDSNASLGSRPVKVRK